MAHAEGDEDLHQDLEGVWASLVAAASRWREGSAEVLRGYALAIESGHLAEVIAGRTPFAYAPDPLDADILRGVIAEFDLIVTTKAWQIGLQALTELPDSPGGVSMLREWVARRWHLSLQQAALASGLHVAPDDLKPVMLVKIWLPGPPEPVPVPGSTLMWDPGKEQVGELRARLLEEGRLRACSRMIPFGSIGS